MARRGLAKKLCIDCRERARWLFGRCPSCYRALDPAQVERLRRLPRAARLAELSKLELPSANLRKWEYTNDAGEAELATKCGQDSQQ